MLKKEIDQSYHRIKKYIYKTGLVKSFRLSSLLNAEVYYKLENMQRTSSFKVRGAFNKLLTLLSKKTIQRVVAASSGNHGAALAYACSVLDIELELFVPQNVERAKIEKIEKFKANVIYKGSDCLTTEIEARKYAIQNKLVYISPYNDLEVISGQGTIAYELKKQMEEIDQIYVSIGGGGLISGISEYFSNDDVECVGCLPKNSPAMYECIKAGKIIDTPIGQTLSDGTAGNIEQGAITFSFCQKNIKDYVLVSEEEILWAMHFLLYEEKLLVEGAAALTLACLLKNKERVKRKKVVLVLCGGNIDIKTFI